MVTCPKIHLPDRFINITIADRAWMNDYLVILVTDYDLVCDEAWKKGTVGNQHQLDLQLRSVVVTACQDSSSQDFRYRVFI